MRAAVIIAAGLLGLACDRDELRFVPPSSNPDGGLGLANDPSRLNGRGDGNALGADVSSDGSLSGNSPRSGGMDGLVADPDGMLGQRPDGGPNAGNSPGAGSGRDGAGARGDDMAFDPTGRYSTEGGDEAAEAWSTPPWCEDGDAREELCGNGLDEDCDGWVDEAEGLGDSCSNGCLLMNARWACDTEENQLVCVGEGPQTCGGGETHLGCGNGFLEPGEECDPPRRNEAGFVTCTIDCRGPLFPRCLFDGVTNPNNCLMKPGTVCSPKVGACIPEIRPNQRCPQVPVELPPAEGRSADLEYYYPMIETEPDPEGGGLSQCWVTCGDDEECPSSIEECYMGICVVKL